MRSTQTAIIVRVLPVDGKPGEYTASFTSEFLHATFSVRVKDNILGAVALHRFSEMILKQFGRYTTTGEIEFVFPDSLKSGGGLFTEIVQEKEIPILNR